MPELPKVSQDFTADVSGYLRGIEEMIKAAERFIRENEKAIASVKALQSAINDLHDKDIVITVRYVTEGNLPEVQNVTRVVNQVYRGDQGDKVQPVVQPVVREPSGTAEAFRGVESVRTVMTGSPRESFRGTEFVQPELTGSVPDIFAGLENITPVLTKSVQDAFQGAESITPILTKSVQDAFSGAESITPVLTGSIQEAFAGAENITPVLTGKIQEAFQGVENISPKLTGNIQDAFHGVEFIQPVLTGKPQEAFKGTESITSSAIPPGLFMPPGGLSKAELLDIAKQVNLAGRDTMSKQELITSLGTAQEASPQAAGEVSAATLAEAQAMNVLRDKYAEVFAAGRQVTQGQDAMAQAILRGEGGFARVLSDVDRMASQYGVLGGAVRAFEADMAELEHTLGSTETHTETFLAGTRAVASGMGQAASTAKLLNDANEAVMRGQFLASAAEAAGAGDTEKLARVMADAAGAGRLLAAASGGAAGGIGKASAAADASRDPIALMGTFWGRWGQVIHYVIMLSAEFLAVFIPALVALAAAMMVALQAAQDVQIRMGSLYTVAEALGPAVGRTSGQMVGLGNALQQAQDAMQPAVYEAFGGVINALKDHFGGLWTMGENVIRMFDTFIAKLDVELKSGLGQQLSDIVSKGAQDLLGFAQQLGNLGRAILNFASAMPGLAEVILKILALFTDLIKIVSEIPAPILTAAFALEEFLRWGSLLINVGGRMIAAVAGLKVFGEAGAVIATAGKDASKSAGSFGGLFSTIVSFVADNPLAALAVAAALAIGGFIYWVQTSKSATEQWIASVNGMVSAAPDATQLNTTFKALGENTIALGQAQAVLNTKTTQFTAIASGAQENVNALAGQHQQLTGNLITESSNLVYIASRYGVDVPTAMGIMQAAGVKLTTNLQGQGTAAAVANQQITNLFTGYQAMGQKGNQLVSSIDAVTIANSTQLASVGKLNTAWKTVINNATGVETGFLGFQQGLATITKNAKVAGASFDGLNAQSLTLRQSFEQNVGTLSTSLQSMNTALAVGGTSWSSYRQYIATTVGEMLHIGNLSPAQVAQLGLIASAAGFKGAAGSYSQLQSWVSKYGGTQDQANRIINDAAIKMSNLNGQIQAIMGTDINTAIASSALSVSGFQKDLSNAYAALAKSGPSSKNFKDALKIVDDALLSVGVPAQMIPQYNKAIESSYKPASDAAANAAKKMSDSQSQARAGIHIANQGIISDIKDTMDAVVHTVTSHPIAWIAGGGVLNLIPGWTATMDVVGHSVVRFFGTTLPNFVTQTIPAVGRAVTGFFTGPFSSAVSGAWDHVWSALVTPVVHAFDSVKNFITSSFDGWWKTHGDAVKQIWNAVWTALVAIVRENVGPIVREAEAVWNFLVGLFGNKKVGENFRKVWNELYAIARAFWDATWALTTGGWTVIVDIFKQMFNDLKASWSIFWNILKTIGLVIFQGIYAGIKSVWDLIVGVFSVFIDVLTGHWHQAWTDIKTTGEQIFNAVYGYFRQVVSDLKGLFDSTLKTIKGTWDKDWHDIKDIFTTQVNAVSRAASVFWRDISNGFRTTVDRIKGIWHELQKDFHDPVAFLVNVVYENGIRRLWNDVMSIINGPRLPPEHFAEGGRVPGYGGGDRVHAMLEAGEAVVPKHLVSQIAPFMAMNNVPGFAQGGLVNPIGPGLRGERVDMGVDYGGSGPLYALGSGTITSLWNSGWPGGGFIDLRLNPTFGSGYWYYAEDVIPWGNIHVGSGVSAGQQIAMAIGGNSGIEVGWASGSGGQTAAAAAGQQNKHGDPGAFPTAWGDAANKLIKSLGGPGGIVRGPVHGGGFGGITSVFGSIINGVFHAISGTISGLGDAVSIISALATGNGTALTNAMSRLIGPGGAKGELGKMITGLPKAMIKDAVKFVENFAKGHTTTQTTGGGALPHGPVGKNVPAELQFAQSHLAGYGWGQAQMGPLVNLWDRESGWNPFAVNPSSGAYGIPQSLGHGHPYALGDYQAQIIWGLNYIKSAYGSPGAAWAHEQAHNWYDQGGWLMPGVTMAVNNTGRPERVLAPGESSGGGSIEATFHVHTHLNGREIWHDIQKETFRYDMRNRGTITGGMSNLNR